MRVAGSSLTQRGLGVPFNRQCHEVPLYSISSSLSWPNPRQVGKGCVMLECRASGAGCSLRAARNYAGPGCRAGLVPWGEGQVLGLDEVIECRLERHPVRRLVVRAVGPLRRYHLPSPEPLSEQLSNSMLPVHPLPDIRARSLHCNPLCRSPVSCV